MELVMYIGDWLMVVIILLTIWGIKVEKPIGKINEDFLSLENCNAAKGIFVMVPIFVHITNVTVHGSFGGWWADYGNAFVGCFFFMNGYGLMKQYMNKPNYSKGFLAKRYPKVLIPYIVATLAYWVWDFIFLGFLYPVSGIFNALKCGDPIVSFSWYVIHLLAFYLWFWISICIFKKHPVPVVILGYVYYIVTTIYVFNMGHIYQGFGTQWYQSSLAIPIGMTWALLEKQIMNFTKKKYWVFAGIVFALTIVIYKFGMGPLENLMPEGFSLRSVIARALIMLSVMVAMMKVHLGNPVINFLGKISFEVYLLQGMPILAFLNDRARIENDNLFAFAVIGVTFVFAVIMHYCMGVLFGVLYKRKIELNPRLYF